MTEVPTQHRFIPSMPDRDPEGHKGTFGTVLVVGGAIDPRWMPGAAALAGRAALRSGCGLVVLATPRSLLSTVGGLLPEATLLPLDIDKTVAADAAATLEVPMRDAHALVCGPGLGRPTASKTSSLPCWRPRTDLGSSMRMVSTPLRAAAPPACADRSF